MRTYRIEVMIPNHQRQRYLVKGFCTTNKKNYEIIDTLNQTFIAVPIRYSIIELVSSGETDSEILQK